jgi:hypothetical protein
MWQGGHFVENAISSHSGMLLRVAASLHRPSERGERFGLFLTAVGSVYSMSSAPDGDGVRARDGIDEKRPPGWAASRLDSVGSVARGFGWALDLYFLNILSMCSATNSMPA